MTLKKSMTNKTKTKANKPERVHRDFQEFLLEYLQDPQRAAAYLKATLAEEDKSFFLIALRDVLEAQGSNIASLSEETQLNKQNLYRMLSKGGNPRLRARYKIKVTF
jgi:probable addiction module antidote protein